jgi:hypothetical protein
MAQALTELLKELLSPLREFRVCDDTCLTTAEREVRQCALISHPLRETEHIFQRLGFIGVKPHATSTKTRSKHGVVDSNDRLEAFLRVVKEHYLLMTSSSTI